MTFIKTLDKTLSIEDKKLRKLTLLNMAFKTMPNSYRQFEIKKHLHKLEDITI